VPSSKRQHRRLSRLALVGLTVHKETVGAGGILTHIPDLSEQFLTFRRPPRVTADRKVHYDVSVLPSTFLFNARTNRPASPTSTSLAPARKLVNYASNSTGTEAT